MRGEKSDEGRIKKKKEISIAEIENNGTTKDRNSNNKNARIEEKRIKIRVFSIGK